MSTEQNLTVESVSIQKSWSGGDDAPYNCTVKIKGEYQNIELKLDNEHTQAIVAVVADLIVDGSRQVADALSGQALGLTALEHIAPEVDDD